MTRPDLDAIRARWPEGRLANTAAREDVLALLAHIEELEREIAVLEPRSVMLKRAHDALTDAGSVQPLAFDGTIEHAIKDLARRATRAEQLFVDESDAHQETRTLLTGLWLKQRKADAEQMRKYGISYHGLRKLFAEYDGGELSLGKVLELLRAAARELAKEQLDELRGEYAHLKHREVMLKRAHGALADAGCVVPIELDKTIEHAIHTLAERALTAEERLERVTHERDQERKVFERAMTEAQTDVRELRARIAELEER
jgi:hypothetical protein